MLEIIKDYEKTGKNAFWGGKLTKQFKKWQEKNDRFPLAETEEIVLKKRMLKMEAKIDKLNKIVLKLGK